MDARTQTAAEVASTGSAANQTGARRRQLFTYFGIAVAAAALLYLVYWVLVASHHVSTDDAYIQADVAQVTPQVAGSIWSMRWNRGWAA